MQPKTLLQFLNQAHSCQNDDNFLTYVANHLPAQKSVFCLPDKLFLSRHGKFFQRLLKVLSAQPTSNDDSIQKRREILSVFQHNAIILRSFLPIDQLCLLDDLMTQYQDQNSGGFLYVGINDPVTFWQESAPNMIFTAHYSSNELFWASVLKQWLALPEGRLTQVISTHSLLFQYGIKLSARNCQQTQSHSCPVMQKFILSVIELTSIQKHILTLQEPIIDIAATLAACVNELSVILTFEEIFRLVPLLHEQGQTQAATQLLFGLTLNESEQPAHRQQLFSRIFVLPQLITYLQMLTGFKKPYPQERYKLAQTILSEFIQFQSQTEIRHQFFKSSQGDSLWRKQIAEIIFLWSGKYEDIAPEVEFFTGIPNLRILSPEHNLDSVFTRLNQGQLRTSCREIYRAGLFPSLLSKVPYYSSAAQLLQKVVTNISLKKPPNGCEVMFHTLLSQCYQHREELVSYISVERLIAVAAAYQSISPTYAGMFFAMTEPSNSSGSPCTFWTKLADKISCLSQAQSIAQLLKTPSHQCGHIQSQQFLQYAQQILDKKLPKSDDHAHKRQKTSHEQPTAATSSSSSQLPSEKDAIAGLLELKSPSHFVLPAVPEALKNDNNALYTEIINQYRSFSPSTLITEAHKEAALCLNATIEKHWKSLPRQTAPKAQIISLPAYLNHDMLIFLSCLSLSLSSNPISKSIAIVCTNRSTSRRLLQLFDKFYRAITAQGAHAYCTQVVNLQNEEELISFAGSSQDIESARPPIILMQSQDLLSVISQNKTQNHLLPQINCLIFDNSSISLGKEMSRLVRAHNLFRNAWLILGFSSTPVNDPVLYCPDEAAEYYPRESCYTCNFVSAIERGFTRPYHNFRLPAHQEGLSIEQQPYSPLQLLTNPDYQLYSQKGIMVFPCRHSLLHWSALLQQQGISVLDIDSDIEGSHLRTLSFQRAQNCVGVCTHFPYGQYDSSDLDYGICYRSHIPPAESIEIIERCLAIRLENRTPALFFSAVGAEKIELLEKPAIPRAESAVSP